MLKKIEGLPSSILALRAEGRLTKDDYEKVMTPLLEEAHRAGRRIRFLYQIGPEFTGFTAGAALDDFRVGFRFFRLFEQCAVVTDIEWVRGATHFVGPFMPCPIKLFKNDQLKEAVAWLEVPSVDSKLKFEMKDNGVLIVHPQGALSRADFDKLASVVDPWIDAHQSLRGVVICVQKFPGWENVGSFIRHFDFVRSHQRKIRRVAIAMDGTLPALMSNVAGHFVEAEIKSFQSNQVEEAVKWVGGSDPAGSI